MIKPVLDKVLVKAETKSDTSAGGIFIPDGAGEDKTTKGLVIAVGPGKQNEKTGKFDPMQVQLGDTVIFGGKSGVAIETDEGPLLMMHEAEILAVLR